MQASSNHSNLISTITELEAEIRHNQQRINRLQQRNDRLTQKLAQIDAPDPRFRQQQDRPQSAPRSVSSAPRTRKFHHPQPKKRPQISRQWLSIGMIALCLAFTCATIGFAITRLVSMR
jgi:septal ring factor EnvC (AmiA/AmiB activator)